MIALFRKKRTWDGEGDQGLELKRSAGSTDRSPWEEEEEEAEESCTPFSSYTVEEPSTALVPWVASPLEDPGQWARQVQLAPHEEWSLWLWNLGSMYEPLCEEGGVFHLFWGRRVPTGVGTHTTDFVPHTYLGEVCTMRDVFCLAVLEFPNRHHRMKGEDEDEYGAAMVANGDYDYLMNPFFWRVCVGANRGMVVGTKTRPRRKDSFHSFSTTTVQMGTSLDGELN